MNLEQYLQEVTLKGTDEKIENLLNIALKEVFTKEYVAKIDSTLKKAIKIKEKNLAFNEAAYTAGKTIVINSRVFHNLEYTQKITLLLHEFIHILQKNKGFFSGNKFKEIINLSNKLWDIANRYKLETLGDLLLNKKVPKEYLNKNEILSYLMNSKFNWSKISPEGKEEFVKTLKNSRIINISSDFWTARLN